MTMEQQSHKKTSSSKMQNQADIGSFLNEPKLYATDLHFSISEDDLKSTFKDVELIRLAVGFFCILSIEKLRLCNQ